MWSDNNSTVHKEPMKIDDVCDQHELSVVVGKRFGPKCVRDPWNHIEYFTMNVFYALGRVFLDLRHSRGNIYW